MIKVVDKGTHYHMEIDGSIVEFPDTGLSMLKLLHRKNILELNYTSFNEYKEGKK